MKISNEVEEKDLFDIFTDGGSGQLATQLLKSKRKLLNAKVKYLLHLIFIFLERKESII